MADRPSKKAKQVEDYRHAEATRLNNPPAGLAWQDTEKPPKRRFEYDPHLDPQLIWAGKAERKSFDVEAPSIHVHERLSTEAIVRAVQKQRPELTLFEDHELDRSKTIEFYRHEMGWVNRFILGDSLVVMTSLLEKERLAGQVRMIYVDPPYGINFNSNFQARISNRTPKEASDEALTREPEQVQAYRDTWQLGLHSYLTYLRDRLLLSRELLSDEGSLFVQIGPDNVHVVRSLLDEVFGRENACTMIVATTTAGLGARLLPDLHTHLLWYAKKREVVKYRQLYADKEVGGAAAGAYTWVELADGTRRRMSAEELADPSKLPTGSRPYRIDNLTSQGFRPNTTIPYEYGSRVFHPGANQCWKTTKEGLDRLAEKGRLQIVGNTLGYVRFIDDLPAVPVKNVWTDMGRAGFGAKKRFVVETVPKLVARCLLMTTDPGDLVLDPTCGSGTTAYVAEQCGRRWITCDTSRVALSIARERLLTATFPYYELRDHARDVDGGFIYRTISRATLTSVAHDLPPEPVPLYDQPEIDNSKIRVSGPFTVEALSRYAMNPAQIDVPPEPEDPQAADAHDHMETLLDALKKQGIPRKGENPIAIGNLQRLTTIGAIQAEGTYLANGESKTFAVSLGPRFGPVTVAQIDDALHDAYGYSLVVFTGFAATAEALDYVKKGKLGKFNVAILEANPDLLVGDLLKATPSSQTFRLFSSPDVQIKATDDGELKVEVLGVDSFDASSGKVVSRAQRDIACWLLDQDYDGIVFHVTQAFFPRTNGWQALQKALKGTIDPDLWERLESFESLPFEAGQNKKAAVRVIDDSGTTSEAVLEIG